MKSSGSLLAALLFLLLFNCSLFLNIGIPSSYVYLFALFLVLSYITLYKVFYISKSNVGIIILLTFLQAIDKINDAVGTGDLGTLFPIVFTPFFLLFIMGSLKDPFSQVFIRRASLVGAVLLLFWGYLSNIQMRELDRDASVMLVFWYFLYVLSDKKHKIIIGLFVFFFVFQVLEARTASMSVVLFMILNKVRFEKKTSQIFILTLAIIVAIAIIAFAVYYEYYYLVSYTDLFTGRGLIWGETVLNFINEGDLRNHLLGFSSSSDQLMDSFGWFGNSFQGRGRYHIADILLRGNFHNMLVYELYNTGLIGILIVLICFYTAIKSNNYNYDQLVLLVSVLFVCSFQGRSIVGIYATSIIFQITLFISPQKIKK